MVDRVHEGYIAGAPVGQNKHQGQECTVVADRPYSTIVLFNVQWIQTKNAFHKFHV